MLDTNLFNHTLDGGIPLMVQPNVSLIATHVQWGELHATKKYERREQLLKVFKLINPDQEPTASFVLEVSSLDEARLGDETDDLTLCLLALWSSGPFSSAVAG